MLFSWGLGVDPILEWNLKNVIIFKICIAETLCGCPNGQKRPSIEEKCRPVESWQIPLWIIRKNNNQLLYNETFANPLNPLNKEYVRLFEKGIAQCYPQTLLKFV